jgi:glycosyltransferase involved in cell wall biosynthesis
LARAELCVYPSITTKKWEEQVGTVNFQALSCGTPVLTTQSGAIPEYIKDGEAAILVREKSARDIAEALIKFFGNARLAKKLTSQARETAKRYDIKKEIAKAEKLFTEVLNES